MKTKPKNKQAARGSLRGMVLVRCPECRKKRMTEREGEPKRCTEIIIRCPACDQKYGFLWPTFLDSKGRDVFAKENDKSATGADNPKL